MTTKKLLTNTKIDLLIFENDPAILRKMEKYYKKPSIVVHVSNTLEDAKIKYIQSCPAVILTEIRLKGTSDRDGIELIKYIRQNGNCSFSSYIFVYTAFGDNATKRQLFSAGVDAYFEKSFSLNKLFNFIQLECVKRRNLAKSFDVPEKNRLPEQNNEKRILIVDDDEIICEILEQYLVMKGYLVDTAFSAEQAIELFKKVNYDLCLSDIKMPGMDGIELMLYIKSRWGIPVILSTGEPSLDSALDGLKLGASYYLTKPYHLEEMNVLVERAIYVGELEKKCNIRNEFDKELYHQFLLKQKICSDTNTLTPYSENVLPFIIGGFLHDIRNALSGASMCAHLLATESKNSLNKQLEKSIQDCASIINALHETIQPLYSEQGSHNLSLLTNFPDLAQSIKTLFQKQDKKGVLELNGIKEMPDIKLPQTVMYLILCELINNAFRYTKKNDPHIVLTFSFDSLVENMTIQYEDDGQGFPLKIRKFYKEGTRVLHTPDGKAHYGLYIICQIVRRLKGTIVFGKSRFKGAEINISLKVNKNEK